MKGAIAMQKGVRLRRLATAAMPVAAALTFAGAAHAQVAPSDRLAFGVNTRIVHDTNLSGGNPDFSAARDISIDDTIYSVGASVVGNIPLGRQSLFVNASGDIQRYEKNTIFNGEYLNFTGGISGKVGSCGDLASVAYSRQLTPGAELLVPIPKNIVTHRSIAGSGTCTLGHFIAGVQAGYTEVQNSAEDAGLLNYHSTQFSSSLGYSGQEIGSISLLGQYTQLSYERPPGISARAGGYKSYEVGVRYSRRIGLRLSGTADLTYNHSKTEPGSGFLLSRATEFNGWSPDVLLGYRVSSRTQLELMIARQVVPAQVDQSGFDVAETFRLSGTHQFGSRFALTAAASLVRTNYSHGDLAFVALRSDEVRTVLASGSMKLGRHLKLAVDAQHLDREANLPLFTYKSDRVGMTIAGEF